MVRLAWLLFPVLASLLTTEAYKILIVFPFPGKSHNILAEGYVRILLEAGHEVTHITPFPQKNPHKNLHQIDVSANADIFPANLINITAILDNEVNPDDMSAFFEILLNLGQTTFNNKNVQDMLNDPNQKFDLVIIEWLFSDLAVGYELDPELPAVYNCPYIWFSTVEPHWIVLSLIDEALHPAYNSDAMSSGIPPYTFKQRVEQLWTQISTSFFRSFFFLTNEEKLYDQIFRPFANKKGIQLPSYNDMRYNASLMFGNSHVALGQATRLPQNYKPIAGYHIDPNVKPLPQDLKNIMEQAKNGVIYFSMGSNLKSKDMPDKLKKNLLKMFAELKYTVLWKFEEVLPDLPKNVHMLKWAPQPSILAHPNCILFITHGGLLSTTETVHFGVPIIGIPVFADQFINVDRAVNKGFAKRVNLAYTMVDDLKVAIEDILSVPKYAQKVKDLSLVYHDRVASPGAEVVHWTEHVVRTRGALHLRSPALMVPWYQKMYLDLALVILVVLIILKKGLQRLLCPSKKISSEKKNK